MAKILKVIVNIILICSIVMAGALLLPPVMGVRTLIVDSAELNTNLGLGTVTYANDKSVLDLKKGDKILDENAEGSFVYEIESFDSKDSSFKLRDYYQKDSELVTETLRNEAAKVICTVPFIGYVVMAMQSMEGLIIISLAIVFVIILFVLSELWKKTDDEEEDEYEDQDEEEVSERNNAKKMTKEEKKREKKRRIAEKKADKYGGFVEDYMDEDAPLLPAREENQEQAIQTPHLADAIMEAAAFELAQDIGAVTEEGTDSETESIADPVIQQSNVTSNNVISNMTSNIEETDSGIEEMTQEPRIVIPRLTAEELIQKALAEGDQPEVIEDKESGITILDYSDIL